MKAKNGSSEIRFFGGRRALPIRLKYLASFGKYILDRNRYPLFAFSARKGGLSRTTPMLRELKLCKIVKHGDDIRFSLNVPRWPSRPFDRMVAGGGLNITAAGTPFKRHIDMAILAVTRKCTYGCAHCYEHFNIAEEDDVPVEAWKTAIRDLQAIGTGVIVLSGGEPLLRMEALLELLRAGDHDLSEFHLHTSGHGANLENARALRSAGLRAAAVGLDDCLPERNDALRGYLGAYEEAVGALRYFQEAGIFTYLNVCLTRDLVRSSGLKTYLDLAKDLGVGIIRFLEPRPCGSYLAEDPEALFSEADRAEVVKLFEAANISPEFRDFPLISYEAYFEAPHRMGCMMGGLSHLYIDSRGNVEPCVFVPVSFGNIMDDSFPEILARMRAAIPHPLHTPCPSLTLAETVRTKQAEGIGLPLPYAAIKEEWEGLSRL